LLSCQQAEEGSNRSNTPNLLAIGCLHESMSRSSPAHIAKQKEWDACSVECLEAAMVSLPHAPPTRLDHLTALTSLNLACMVRSQIMRTAVLELIACAIATVKAGRLLGNAGHFYHPRPWPAPVFGIDQHVI
jgi:hypothetical protein